MPLHNVEVWLSAFDDVLVDLRGRSAICWHVTEPEADLLLVEALREESALLAFCDHPVSIFHVLEEKDLRCFVV